MKNIFKKGILSLHKEIGDGRYNRFHPTLSAPDTSKEYDKFSNGWRKKLKDK